MVIILIIIILLIIYNNSNDNNYNSNTLPKYDSLQVKNEIEERQKNDLLSDSCKLIKCIIASYRSVVGSRP